MKTTTFALSALVAAVTAQDFSGLNGCAAACGQSMLSASKARELGCGETDLQCLCANPDFTYGLRDCAREACAGDDQEALVQAGLKVCSNVGVGVTTGSDGEPTVTATATGAIVTTLTSDGSAWTTSTKNPSDVVASVTSALGSATSAAGGAASSASGAAGSASGAVTSAVGSASDAVTSALGSASGALSSAVASASGALSSAIESANPSSTESGSEASSTNSDDAAIPMRTAAPAGILAAAGLAVLML